MKYERDIYQFLSVYRFFSFAIAVVLIQVVPLMAAQNPTPQTYLILTSFGIYNLLKVFSRIHWKHKSPMTYIVLWGDLFVSILLVFLTGGLKSGFLLYSLIPLITASLLFEQGIALLTASLLSLSLAMAHTVLSQMGEKFVWFLQDNYLPLLIIYIIVCFVIATMSYRTNLNILQRIKRDAILEERRRMKQETHDGVAQTLTYLNLKIAQLTKSLSSQQTDKVLAMLSDIQATARRAYEDVRESIDQLSSEMIDFPLLPTLSGYVLEFGEKNNIKTRFDTPRDLPNLSDLAQLQLMRIAQEALTNVRRHAQATEVRVSLEDTPKEIKMMVKDNGRGFDQTGNGNSTNLRGLAIMKERAESLGGTLDIVSAPGEGTEIRVCLPREKVRL